MTTNFQIETDRKSKVVLTPIVGTNNSTLTIRLSRALLAWNNEAVPGNNGKYNLNGEGFHVDNDPNNNVMEEEILEVEITGPTTILTTFQKLIFLKDEVKDIGANAKNEFSFDLVFDKDISNQTDHWNITALSAPGADDRVLNLSVADFGGTLDTSKISIDDTEYHNNPDNQIEVVVDRSDQKQALLDLEKLLNETLPSKYPGTKEFEHGPDVDLIDPSFDLGDLPDAAASPPVVASGLSAYYYGTHFDTNKPNIAKDAENIKHILRDLEDEAGDKIYEQQIDDWGKYLVLIKLWSSLGLTKKSQVAIILDTDGGGYGLNDWKEFEKQPGFYKGFPLIDPNLQATPDLTNNNKFKVEPKDPDKPVRYTKENIDNFREFADGYNGPNDDIFSKTNTIQDPNGNDVDIYVNRQPDECLGFQPGDVVYSGGDYIYINGNWKFGGKSKIYYDILSAQNVDEAMDLAYFGRDYDEPLSDDTTRKGNPKELDNEKHPNVNLQFNEVKGWTRLDHLNHYYEALKDKDNCEWRIPNTGAGATDAPKYDNPDTQTKIDEGYNLTKEFIEDYEKWLKVKVANLNKTQLKEVKSKLEKWKTTRFHTSGGVWKQAIDNFLIEVDGALSLLNDDPDDDVPAWKTELSGLKNRGSELAKKIYQNCQPDQDGFTESVFIELKKLVKLLEEAHGTKTANTKSELTQFIAASESDSDKKQALVIAKKIKNQDSDSKDCVELALDKTKSPQDIKLDQTRQKLKSLLAGLKIGDKDAYEEVVAGIKNSETNINKTIEIWQKCQKVEAASNDDNGELLDTLNNLKNDSGNEEAWKAVNKYKKDGQGQGYANDMLKKLNDWAEQRKIDYRTVKSAKSKAEFEVAKVEFMKKHEYQNNQKDYDEIYFPLAEKAAETREKGSSANSKEKELAELMVIVVSDYSDWKTQLEDLETKLNNLKKYIQGGENHNIIESYSTIQQEALKKLVNKMDAKVKEWKSEKAKSENNNNLTPENPPWYKTPLGIFGIIAAMVIVAGTIYYLVKQNNSEEE